jgi:hypothetical protein
MSKRTHHDPRFPYVDGYFLSASCYRMSLCLHTDGYPMSRALVRALRDRNVDVAMDL